MGNQPYNDSQDAEGKRGGENSLWPKFVEESLKFILRRKYLSLVHPSSWRKPESAGSQTMSLFNVLTHKNTVLYLEMHDAKYGIKTFNSGTRYDWYVLQKKINIDHPTLVKDIDGKTSHVKLKDFPWLPNGNYQKIESITTKTPKYDNTRVIFSSAYTSHGKWTHEKPSKNNTYILIHSTTQNGIRCMYTSDNTRGHFGIPKVIFGESGINTPVLHVDGIYGMTQGTMAIPS